MRTILILIAMCLGLSLTGQEGCNTRFPADSITQLQMALDTLEQQLIADGYLASEKHEAYVAYYRKVAEDNEITAKRKRNVLIETFGLKLLQSDCHLLMGKPTEREFVETVMAKTKEESPKSFSELTEIANYLADWLTPEMMDTDYFRNRLLLTIYIATSPKENYGLPLLPMPEKQAAGPPPTDSLNIVQNAKDELFVNKKPIELSDLSKRIEDFVAQFPQDGLVYFLADRGSSYEQFINILDSVNDAYTRLYEKEAQQRFNKSFADVNAEEKKAVRTAIRKNFKIGEPKG